jgi:hypothetical protein
MQWKRFRNPAWDESKAASAGVNVKIWGLSVGLDETSEPVSLH